MNKKAELLIIFFVGGGLYATALFILHIKYITMITVKTYRLKRLSNLVLPIEVNGKQIIVDFVGFLGNRGIYTTAKEEVQKSLEEYPGFGHVYTLASTVTSKTKEEIEAEKAEAKAKAEAEDESSTEKTETNTETNTEYKVKNIQEANALAKKLFGKDAPTFRLTEKVVAYFAERGYSLSF